MAAPAPPCPQDIIEQLAAEKVAGVGDFQWQMQLRHYWEGDQLVVKQVGPGEAVCLQRPSREMHVCSCPFAWPLDDLRWCVGSVTIKPSIRPACLTQSHACLGRSIRGFNTAVSTLARRRALW